jgi:hypothetical protein
MEKGLMKKIKLVITIALVLAFVWFLIISPMITFHDCEKRLEDSAKRYFELNSSELPSGENVKTVTLKTLYKKSFIKKDLFIPYTKKTCSVENSWVKVKRVDGQYKYYTYLECGVLSSTVDHNGPVITLNGGKKISIGKGEKYEEAGVKSVVDNTDGKLSVKDVTIKGEVDTSTIGTYEVTYTTFDSLNNKTVVTREVEVVQKLNSTIKSSLKDAKNFVGNPTDNYIRISNMVFRVYGLDENNNVIIVSNEDIANVNYSKLDKWLSYFYDNLNEFTKNVIVKTKYCNMTLSDTTLDTTKCSGYTKERNVYIPSVIEVNKAQGRGNFMRPNTMSWVANKKDSKNAYLTRSSFFGSESNKTFLAYSVDDNYGVRPMMTIKGDTLITDGDGSSSNPYVFGDTKKAKGGSLLNERFTGEYISIDGYVYRIIKTLNDGTTKVVSDYTVANVATKSLDMNGNIVYDPTKKTSVAYYINNRVSEYVNTKYFVKHEIEVPIYKNKIIYGEETENKKYKVVLSAPDMYEMFGAQPQTVSSRSYWMINTSKTKGIAAVMFTAGSPINGEIEANTEAGIRVVAFVKKGITVSSGSGTRQDPYIIK